MTASTIVIGTLIVIYYTVNEQDSFNKLELINRTVHPNKGPAIIYEGVVGGGGGGVHGVGQAYFFFTEKVWAKREFHNDWGWVIVWLSWLGIRLSCRR